MEFTQSSNASLEASSRLKQLLHNFKRQNLESPVNRPPQHGRNRIQVLIISMLLLAFGGAAVVFSCSQGARDKAMGPVGDQQRAALTVTTTAAKLLPIRDKLRLTGSISAWDPISVGSEVSNLRIESVLVEEGSLVKKGQVLAELNSSIVRAQLAHSAAELAAQEASLGKAIQPNRVQDINAARESVAEAEARIRQEQSELNRVRAKLDEAKIEVDRYQKLFQLGVVSQQQLEQRTTSEKMYYAEAQTAENRIKAASFSAGQAREKLTMALIGGRKEDIDIDKANIAQVKADMQQLEAQLAQTIIKAPADGLVTKRYAHVGDITASGKTLFDLSRDNRLELRAEVPEADLGRCHPGQAVELTASALPDKQVIGKVREISPVVDINSRLGTVRIDVPSGTGLMPGMFVSAELLTGDKQALLVPAASVVYRGNQTIVYTVDHEHAQPQRVVVGEHNGPLVEIVSGLVPGQRVIASGAGLLKENDLVRVAPESSKNDKELSSQ